MCGILFYLTSDNFLLKKDDFLKNLNNLDKRGPDFYDSITFNKNNLNYYFGHTRLSIIDVSSNGHQPMNINNNNILIYNGEIYNHLEIRKKIKEEFSADFLGNSDTETLYHALQNYSIHKVLNMISGMFGFCYYDSLKNEIYIARDRAGEKPIYLYFGENILGISSDIVTFKKINSNYLQLNHNAINEYTQYGYIPNPNTIYKNCFKLPPGSYLKIKLNKFKFNSLQNFNNINNIENLEFVKWWNVDDNIKKISTSFRQTKNNLKKILFNTVEDQLMSDVPIGAFLSSGIDSSLIVSIMSKLRSNINTFTIGFDNKSYDESYLARKISKNLKTNHYEKIMTPLDIKNIIPDLNNAYSEPFADSSQLPSLLISKFARENVKVVLTGDGGDELFGGYNRYLFAKKFWFYYKILPKNLKNFLYKLILYSPKIFLINFSKYLKISDNSNMDLRFRFTKVVEKLKNIYDEKSYYLSMTQEWHNDNILISDYQTNNKSKFFDKSNNYEFIEKMMLSDFEKYLTDDILCKVDRATMNYGLESRAPFLNEKLINYAFSTPIKYKFKKNEGKFILRQILEEFLPKDFVSPIKRGFAVPLENWLENELSDYSNEMLSEQIFKKHDLFNLKKIKKLKKEYKYGYKNHIHKLWILIQFNSWYINNEI